MPVFRPLPPKMALAFVERGGVDQPARMILDFASAGIAPAKALVIEAIDADGRRQTEEHAWVSAEIWKRVIREGASDAVWNDGTVRLPGSGFIGGPPELNITGIRFDAWGLVRIIRYNNPEAGKRPVEQVSDGPLMAAPAPSVPAETVSEAPPKGKTSRILAPAAFPLNGEFLTVNEAKAVLRCGQTKLYDLINAGALERRHTKVGVRITTKSVKAVAGIED